MAILAYSSRMRDLEAEAQRWVDGAIGLAADLGEAPGVAAVRLAAQVELGGMLVGRVATLEQGRALLTEVADVAEAAGEWLVAANALNKLVHLPPARSVRDVAVLLERMRAAAERAGSERLTVAAYYQGRARLSMQRGNLTAATDAIERARAHDLSYQRSINRADFHGAFLAGLRLEAGDLAGAQQVADELAGVPGMEFGQPGLRFHLACRRHDPVRARALLPDVVAVVQSTGGRDGEFLHDLVTAALAAPLRLDEVGKLIDGLDGPTVEPSYRRLVAGQLAEAAGDLSTAVARYREAATSADLPPAPRGTAHIGAARVLLARHHTDHAVPDEVGAHLRTAGELLAQWSGWRVDQLVQLQRRLDPGDARDDSGLTAREREVASLVADGLTNVELAERLFISPRTAAVHVSNILRKLGVPSRTDVAAALERAPR
jgi:DNA-binding CsgD family transcriptional regulator